MLTSSGLATSSRMLSNDLPSCDSYHGSFVEAARRYDLPVAFLCAIARVESGFNPLVVSVKGAMGVMQLMPRTARSMGVRDASKPHENIMGGARYLRVLANRWKGALVLTIASYNAGPAAVQRHRGVPPYAETQGYVQRVLRHFAAYRQGLVLSHR